MPVCDICNAPGVGTLVSADKIRHAAALGFNPFASDPAARLLGMSSDFQYEAWKQQVARDTTDWNVCPKCMKILEPYFHPREAEKDERVRMLESVLRTRGVPCDRCKKAVRVDPAVIAESARKMASGVTCEFVCPECGSTIVLSPQQEGQRPTSSRTKKWWEFWR